MPVKIIVAGALGRMGAEICRIALDDNETALAGCTERRGHPDLGKDIGSSIGAAPLGIVLKDSFDAADGDAVIIDFTSPDATIAMLEKTKDSSARAVIGTTGLADEQIKQLEVHSRDRAILFSPNMSIGVNLLFYLTEIAASRLANKSDIEIIEAHHRHKKDAPSGTARKLGEIIADAMGRAYDDAVINGRNGITGERSHNEIGMHAVRGGDIVGDHTVLFACEGERIELRHMAHNRSNFAQGAVIAAKWLSSQQPGLYSMRDVLGF
jgi:4-hydroxy-tetrahydrodipicolinate reductase